MSVLKNGAFLLMLSASLLLPASEQTDYERYRSRITDVEIVEDIGLSGFTILEDHVFQTDGNALGTVTVLPSLDPKIGRLILFFTDAEGRVVYQTDELECNNWIRGSVNQPNVAVAATGAFDLNNDGLKDIVLISRAVNQTGPHAGVPYKIGDVLFQSETGFYRDWRVSDKINRFSMNADIGTIMAFVRDGYSAEFLYSADTLKELTQRGFQIIDDRAVSLERFGEVRMVSGTYRMNWRYVLMIYLTDADGNVVWNFQPMGSYTNFNRIKDTALADIDGDGLTDVAFLIQYDTLTTTGETVTVTDYVLYYQRQGYFEQDTVIKSTLIGTDDDALSELMERAAAYGRNRHD